MSQANPTRPVKGVIAVAARAGRLLVIERSQHVRAPGAFCFPGGGCEPGESPEQTVVREMQEELAAEVRPVGLLWQSVTAWSVELAWWEVQLRDAEQLVANPAEVAAVHWLLPDEVRALPKLLSSNHAFLDAWVNGEFSVAGVTPPGRLRPDAKT